MNTHKSFMYKFRPKLRKVNFYLVSPRQSLIHICYPAFAGDRYRSSLIVSGRARRPNGLRGWWPRRVGWRAELRRWAARGRSPRPDWPQAAAGGTNHSLGMDNRSSCVGKRLHHKNRLKAKSSPECPRCSQNFGRLPLNTPPDCPVKSETVAFMQPTCAAWADSYNWNFCCKRRTRVGCFEFCASSSLSWIYQK